MAVSMNCNALNCNHEMAFKSKWSRTEQGTPYYKTNSATIAGGVLAVPAFFYQYFINNAAEKNGSIGTQFLKGMFKEASKDESVAKEINDFYKAQGLDIDVKNPDKFLNEIKNAAKEQKKLAIPLATLAALLTVGSGVIVDSSRNKKAKETANYVAQVGTRNALMTRGNKIELSDNSRPYYKSNEGKKLGAILGAGCACVFSAVSVALAKLPKGMSKPQQFLISALGMSIWMGLGGFIMGAISDSMTNSKAERNA